ncbi:hypothetical protein lerEdw1_006754 [Lerista edwardsae]|nr:hypothetical protein lerEdw1_006754 [Lerista edwardsae]
MDGVSAYGMDKQFAPNPVRILDPPDNPQARKNFSVSHLLDLEEVAAAGMNGAKEPGPEAREGGKGAREHSGGSSGSEGGALQEGRCARSKQVSINLVFDPGIFERVLLLIQFEEADSGQDRGPDPDQGPLPRCVRYSQGGGDEPADHCQCRDENESNFVLRNSTNGNKMAFRALPEKGRGAPS